MCLRKPENYHGVESQKFPGDIFVVLHLSLPYRKCRLMTTQMNSSGIMPQFRRKPYSWRHIKNTGLYSMFCQSTASTGGGIHLPRLFVDPGFNAL